MKVKELTITAVIPSAQYANLQPSITVEVDDDVEEAKALAMSHIVGLSQRYAEEGKALKGGKATSQAKRIECFVGGSVLYDDNAHIYTNEAGDVYLSGSQYAKKFGKEFAKEAIAEKMAAKSGVPASEILQIWQMGGKASMSFGTAIHEALEMYGKFTNTCKVLEKEYHQSNIPMVKAIVDDFFKGREQENALYEPMVADHDRKWAGQIDRLLIVDEAKKICRIQDYKTNGELKPETLEQYWHQLSFYGSIMQAHGWTVEGLDIHHWSSKWTTHSNKMKEVK